MNLELLEKKLPLYVLNKIFLYIKHPLPDMIREYWIRNLSIKLLKSLNNNKYELQFPLRKHEFEKLDNSIFKYSWFIYALRYYENEGFYGSIKIIDLEDD
jgi:hypothetical protein